MMLLVVLALVGVAYGQLGPGGPNEGPGGRPAPDGPVGGVFQGMRDRLDDTIDNIHFWRLEDHTNRDGDHYLLFINDNPQDSYCKLIMVNDRWEDLLESHTFQITEEIYALVMDPDHRERALQPSDLRDRYQDFDAFNECRNHDTAIVRYTPSRELQNS